MTIDLCSWLLYNGMIGHVNVVCLPPVWLTVGTLLWYSPTESDEAFIFTVVRNT